MTTTTTTHTARKVTQEGRVYKTRKGAQNYIDGFLAEVDLGWRVIEVTRGHFAIVRPALPGDEERGDRVYTLARKADSFDTTF